MSSIKRISGAWHVCDIANGARPVHGRTVKTSPAGAQAVNIAYAQLEMLLSRDDLAGAEKLYEHLTRR